MPNMPSAKRGKKTARKGRAGQNRRTVQVKPREAVRRCAKRWTIGQIEEEQTARAIEQTAAQAQANEKSAPNKNQRRRGACGLAKIEEAKRKARRRRQEKTDRRFKKQSKSLTSSGQSATWRFWGKILAAVAAIAGGEIKVPRMSLNVWTFTGNLGRDADRNISRTARASLSSRQPSDLV